MKVLRDVKKLKIYMLYVPKKIKMQGKMIKMTVREREMYILMLYGDGEVVARAKRTTGLKKAQRRKLLKISLKRSILLLK